MQAYYAKDEERDRLAAGIGQVEFLRTIEVVGRDLPPPPAVVADIGGGPGRYTDHLLNLGYQVLHRDLVAHHVDQVRARHPVGTDTGDRLDTAAADACHLDLVGDSVDAVLLLGPLYHLPDQDRRLQALAEAIRVVRPGGTIHAAAISRHAVLFDGILVKRLDRAHPQILDVLDEVLVSGRLHPLFEGSFNGYTHTPDQLRAELEQAGLVVERLVNVEGVSFALGDLDERLDDPEDRERLLFALRTSESAPDLLGVGPHLLATARTRN